MQVSTASLLNSGLSSIQNGQRRVDQAASDIANSNLPSPRQAQQAGAADQVQERDLATSLVDLRVGKIEAQAGAKVVATADAVLGTLLDTRA